MRMPSPRLLLCGALSVGVLLGCSSPEPFNAVTDAFEDTNTFTRNYAAPPAQACEAARRSLLSQGYIITSSTSLALTARKHFQQSRDQHYEIEFNVTCVSDRGRDSTVFVNAVQQNYVLKKTNTSASVGVSVVGSLSMPIASVDDSLVKVGSATITQPGLYARFFGLLEDYLSTNGGEGLGGSDATLNPRVGDVPSSPDKAKLDGR
ncbi:DUF2242 domain-containing protein [Pigmentiphaga aceris]|uniref:DUF2242 domain-containing protein n=1 Tax=Pigmentiphaga aceris TaxID=1940612 RepID=A0A5C0AXV4_9BURK|nr:DUF2242 domain-containing protein [Pigmentiphaga aceris]QEI05660.1 DUF2242 domain-containing protein [Pigmentiphaga aceris]